VSAGGELIGSMSFLGEHAPPGRRGLFASWTGVGATIGTLAGSATAALLTQFLSPHDLRAWGWRLPFVAGVAVGLVGLWVRRGVGESETFTAAVKRGVSANPLAEVLRQDFAAVAATAGLALLFTVSFYLPFVWLSTWLGKILRPPLSEGEALWANTLALAWVLVVSPLGGALSDRVGRKPVMLAGALVFALGSYPLFLLLSRGTFASALAAQLVFATGFGLFASPATATFVELFPTRTRYSGIALGYNAVQAVFGGTAPFVATWLIDVTGHNRAPAFYLILTAVVAVVTLLCVRDRHDEPLR
jgi:MHS family proline/betaine transporter-like MFS transporter